MKQDRNLGSQSVKDTEKEGGESTLPGCRSTEKIKLLKRIELDEKDFDILEESIKPQRRFIYEELLTKGIMNLKVGKILFICK